MSTRFAALLLATGLAAGASGCGSSPTASVPDQATERITLEVSASAIEGAPGLPVTVKSLASNRGRTTVHCFYECAAPTIPMRWLGPDGQRVEVLDPFRIRPMCAGFFGPLDPNGTVSDSEEFNGTLYTDQGEAYDAPSGIYTAVVSFGYSRTEMSWQQQVMLERPISIIWRRP